jgi:hypothetical protein
MVTMTIILISGRQKSSGSGLKASPGKKLYRPHFTKNLVHSYNPSYIGVLSRRIVFQVIPGKNRPYLKSN